jgi:hypothetical protein
MVLNPQSGGLEAVDRILVMVSTHFPTLRANAFRWMPQATGQSPIYG